MFNKIRRFFVNKKNKRSNKLRFKRRRQKADRERIAYFVTFAIELVVTIALAYFCVFSFGKQVECANVSMDSTISSGDSLLVNTLSYKFVSPKSGDIVAFKPAKNVNASYSIKRIVAVPGDTVLIKNGKLYVNDEQFNSLIADSKITDPGIAAVPLTLSEEEYFVLGDNRDESEDSRYETIGNIKKEDILGRIWFDITNKKLFF